MIDLDRLYIDLVQPGLRACFLAAAPSLYICEFEPDTVQVNLLYSLLDERTSSTAGQVLTVTYTTLHYVCIPYADPAGAEALAMVWVDAIPNAALACREFEKLAGVEPLKNKDQGRIGGKVEIPRGRLGWRNVGGPKVRAIEFTSTTQVMIDLQRIRSLT